MRDYVLIVTSSHDSAQMRPKGMGLGAGGDETEDEEEGRPRPGRAGLQDATARPGLGAAREADEEGGGGGKPPPEKRPQNLWKARNREARVKRVYKTAAEVLAEVRSRPSFRSQGNDPSACSTE